MAKKTTTKNTKKNVVNKAEQPIKSTKKTKNAEEMSVEELANMFVQNDTQTIERLKAENKPETIIDVPEQAEPEKTNELEKIFGEVVAEQPKKDTKKEPKPKIGEVKAHENKKTEQEQVKTQQKPQQTNTNRSVYGYDHFGIIYGY